MKLYKVKKRALKTIQKNGKKRTLNWQEMKYIQLLLKIVNFFKNLWAKNSITLPVWHTKSIMYA